MRSPALLLALLPCAPARSPPGAFSRRRGPPSKPALVVVPRGGSDDSSGSSAPSMPDMSSLLSGAGLGGGMPDLSKPPSPEQVQKSMEAFTGMLSNPQFKEALNDPAKLEAGMEQMRQSLLRTLDEMERGDNPMMKMMMEQMKGQMASTFPGGWDGMKEMVGDREKWKEMVGGLVDVIKSLGEEDIGKIVSQMAGMPGMPGAAGLPGLGGSGGMAGMGDLGGALGDTSGTLAGLDDLSEGED